MISESGDLPAVYMGSSEMYLKMMQRPRRRATRDLAVRSVAANTKAGKIAG